MGKDWAGELYCGVTDTLIYLCLNMCTGISPNTGIIHSHSRNTVYMSHQLSNTYSRKSQEMSVQVESKALDKEGTLDLHQVIDSFLYYVRTIDMPILHTLNSIPAVGGFFVALFGGFTCITFTYRQSSMWKPSPQLIVVNVPQRPPSPFCTHHDNSLPSSLWTKNGSPLRRITRCSFIGAWGGLFSVRL